MLSVWGVLISFWSVLVFSPILLSLFIIITALLLLSLLLLLFNNLRPVALSGYESIAHEAKPNGLLTRGP